MNRNLPLRPKRIVVKVGTGILTGSNRRLNKSWIRQLVGQIAALIKQEIQVILVTSGAIGAGMGTLGLEQRPVFLPRLQAAAAIGQGQLMRIYDLFFKPHGLITAQVLLTREDLSNRRRYLNARNTLLTILSYRAIPVINENDTVSVDEIKFGDNDKLSALVANLVHADLLIILSDVDGLYSSCPKKGALASKQAVVSVVEKIDAAIEKMARGTKSQVGTGGMAAKVEAAKICCASGIACVVANGKSPNVLLEILANKKIGTLFVPKKEHLVAKKQWIGFSAKLSGQIMVDQGAKQALMEKNKSLLPKGVIMVHGAFSAGDTVSILDADNREFARGRVNYSAPELLKIKGQATSHINAILGYKHEDEVVHRDNLVIL